MTRRTPSKKRKVAASAPEGAAGEQQQVVVTLHPEAWLDPARPEVNATAVIEKLLDRIRRKSGTEPERVQVFGNIGAFAISADASFIEGLAPEPEVLSVRPNAHEESMKIEPVKKRAVAYAPRPAKKR